MFGLSKLKERIGAMEEGFTNLYAKFSAMVDEMKKDLKNQRLMIHDLDKKVRHLQKVVAKAEADYQAEIEAAKVDEEIKASESEAKKAEG